LNQSPNKPLNLKLYLILSALPLISLAPLRKLKKLRIIIFINAILALIGYAGTFLITRLGYNTEIVSLVSNILIYIVSTVIQMILVTKWVKQFNATKIKSPN